MVDHRTGPLLVLAGPGTGKTTTLVEAVARRVRDGADPERLLVLTFSRKAAVELRDRIAARLGSAAAPQATTFHSYCYALVRAHQDADLFADPLRLLSGPEQDLVVRELLEGQAGLAAAGRARVRWPDELRACLTTRGFADEVRAVLARSRELGLGPEALADFARRTGRPDWGAAADFLAEYLDVLDAQGVLDYAELVHRAVLLAERDEVAAELAARYDAVFVDEYQDTDASQIRLLRALAGGGRTLVAFGDPDQSIYAFRGADVNGILDFPLMFPRTGGDPAPVEVLGTSRRSGAAVLAATRRLTSRMPLTRLPAQKVREHRDLAAVRDGGRVEVYTYPTPGAELDNIADILRRAHLEDGVPWRDMAVLVRAGARSIPGVRRALTSAGVPLEIDGDELPLRREPAVAPLLTALRVAASAVTASTEAASAVVAPAPADEALAEDAPAADAPVPADGSTEAAHGISTETAIELLTSPLGGMDAADLRRLGRALREEERVAGHDVPPPSDELIARALAEPERLVAHDPAYARGARHLGELLRTTRDLLAAGGTAEEALWTLWDGTPTWSQRLERTARRGGAAARNADRDLDAVVALFETAARAEARTGGRGALNFLEELDAQDIAADTLTRRTVRPDAVRLMTAHRSKGLEWRLVVVAGVQEGLWPDLRRRGSLLEADRIGRDGLAEPLPPGALLTEERRLFYVAATRARDRLVVTAVKAASDDGDQPSRFLTELGVELRDVTGRPRRPLSVAALVAELRATTVDPQATPALREAAAQRLAKLAALRDDDGQPLVPAAHPDQWWGLYEPTHSAVPLRDRDRPVTLSGSALDQLANTCALQWFLGREVKADSPATAAQGFGNVVHVLADEVASGRTPADLSVLMERLDSVWDALAFDAPWKSRQEKDNARAALERFLRWHVMERATLGRETVATEHGFDVTLEAGEYAVRIRGSMDRVERDAEGRAYVVDFKTGKQKPTGPEVARHPQLAVYQLAVREGAVDAVFEGRRPEPGGAELVHLRLGAPQKEGGDALPAVQAQGPVDGEWVGELLATAAGRVLEERFTPTTGQHCTHCTFRNSCSALPEGQHVVE
ncbi:ATP-dependent DNA helicase PcrA [Streptomyces rimosus subsp. rimosus]|uniref:DNA 3'-5' helicase n=1 Tax=Streptomyces rimosus subsp. rimosus TaxID=132474 RepID=A0ABY3YYR2_STRRM|nr:ATP-dependent DNA helicase PcrA [Streptomyces rimosus subsp. rimosus]UTH94737.1 ATP-dependent DNA helicase PcrA [Streptomyces rimosus subsp. rimosus]UTJ12834.1 ATP-dependent DNA helicase PcrA [Streptomyces rimosus subsp. rimosus]